MYFHMIASLWFSTHICGINAYYASVFHEHMKFTVLHCLEYIWFSFIDYYTFNMEIVVNKFSTSNLVKE